MTVRSRFDSFDSDAQSTQHFIITRPHTPEEVRKARENNAAVHVQSTWKGKQARAEADMKKAERARLLEETRMRRWCVAVTYVFGHILGGTLKGYAVQRHFWHIF